MIRPRQQADMGACVAILADVHRVSGYPAHWPADPHRWLTPFRHLAAWVAEQDGAVVGHVSLTSALGEAAAELWSARTGRAVEEAVAVSRLFVAQSARGRRLGGGCWRRLVSRRGIVGCIRCWECWTIIGLLLGCIGTRDGFICPKRTWCCRMGG